MQPTKEWLEAYEQKKQFLTCATDLNSYFTAREIAKKKLDTLSIGTVSLPTGKVIVCDPLAGLSPHNKPYFLSVPPGEYEVVLAVVTPEESDDCARYAAARVRFSKAEAVRYVEALACTEDLSSVEKQGDGFGFPVDAGLACITDAQTHDAFLAYEKKWKQETGKDANIYDDYFAALMAENFRKNPRYQRDGGDWLNWQIPGTDFHIPIFQSGFGDGYYPAWFGYDENGEICSLVVQFIDIEAAYADKEQDEEDEDDENDDDDEVDDEEDEDGEDEDEFDDEDD